MSDPFSLLIDTLSFFLEEYVNSILRPFVTNTSWWILGLALILFIALLSLLVVFGEMAWRQVQVISQAFRSPVIDKTRHGGELVGKTLKEHGVKNVFTLSGGHIAPILVGAEKEGIRVIDTRHEVNAVFAADAVARVSGTPGVAVVTAGPGLTNTVTAVKNAQMAESPVVLMGGCAATLTKGKGALQDIDHMSVFKSITKWQKTVHRVADIVPSVREAFQAAQSGTPGPVFLELPLDILYQYPIVEKEFLLKSKGTSLVSKVLSWYLKQYAKYLFGDGFREGQDFSPLPIKVPLPSSSDIAKAAEMIKSAKSPVILLGSQAVLPPVPVNDIRAAIETIGIPAYLGGMSRGLLGTSSQIQMRQKRREALQEADIVLMAGTVADFRLGYGSVISKKSKVIAVNRDKGQLYKNSGLFWNPTLAIQADVGSFFKGLREKLSSSGYQPPSDWVSKLRTRDDEVERKNAKKAGDPVDKYLNPVKVFHDLDKVLPENTYLVADGGDFVATASYIVRPKGPLRWLDPGAFGTLGCGGGFALGIKATIPDATVVIIYGDGSVGYTIMELDTMVRHNLPCTAIVGNDACWTQIIREQVSMLGSPVACPLAYTDYHKVSEAVGGLGYKLDEKDKDKLQDRLSEAIKKTITEKKPVLVNVLIGKTDFREGSVSV